MPGASRKDVQVLIAVGTSLSAAIDLGNGNLAAILMPAGWDAAGLTFQGSIDGLSAFSNIYDAGTELTLTVAAGRYQTLDPTKWLGIRYVKVRSGTSGAPVVQTADRVLSLLTIPVPGY